MPVWFLVVLLGILAFAVLMAIVMAYSRRSANAQNTTIVERDPSRANQTLVIWFPNGDAEICSWLDVPSWPTPYEFVSPRWRASGWPLWS